MGKFLSGLFVAVIGAAVGVVGTIVYQYKQNEVQYLRYTVQQTTNILESLTGIDQNAKVVVGEKTFQTFSFVSFTLYNTANKDYENLVINIRLRDNVNKSVNVVSLDYIDQNGFKDLEFSTDLIEDGVRYVFRLQAATRDEERPILIVKMAVVGPTIPDFELTTNEAGLVVQQAEAKQIAESASRWGSITDINIATLLSAFTVLAAVMLTFISRFGQYDRRQKSNRSLASLTVLQADYGAGTVWKDVTDIVSGAVADGTIDLEVNDSVFGDPVHGQQKFLRVVMIMNGQTQRRMITQGQRFVVHKWVPAAP